ncbi:Peroxyureidoacrylate/ureidoacrylate amidohydrolase RutB [bioreactor metagenome]|uniref:Peroxyureidoacrylate/ureidoacrylate amidohydrolase RutB n=1 Tax=bioreactor metagenome TaxID=1076179 RepID=A0A644ZZR8_9ZZZZ
MPNTLPIHTSQAHATIRAMSGATPISALSTHTTALIVIDFQNEYFNGRMPLPDADKALNNARTLIAWADENKLPVLHVQHIAPAGSAVFATDGTTVQFHSLMQPRAQDLVVQKDNVSVFVGTDVDAQLRSRNVDTLVIAGLMTHACVAGAARDAAPRGYHVVVASDASATRDITRANGESVDNTALHEGALAEIEDTFGDVLTTAQILQLPLR